MSALRHHGNQIICSVSLFCSRAGVSGEKVERRGRLEAYRAPPQPDGISWQSEVIWTISGMVIGAWIGFMIGGVGIAARGDAWGFPASTLLAIIGALRSGSFRPRQRGSGRLDRRRR